MEVKVNQSVETGREPGLSCPCCGAFIRTSIRELLTKSSLFCPCCLLELRLDREASEEALHILQKVNEAQERVEKGGKFNHE